MSIVLAQELVSSNEAYITWTVNPSLISPSSKGFLYLTDISLFDETDPNNTFITSFPIIKYQLRHNELLSGNHVFENLNVGSYICKLNIINGSTSVTSDPLTAYVYYLAAPEIVEIMPFSNKLTVHLVQPESVIQNVTFILLGKQIIGGLTQASFANALTIIKPYSVDNTYDINNLENNNEYELSCFYTDTNNISSVLSKTLVESPTNSPNQVTNLAAIYDSVEQTLTITYNMPNNSADYPIIDSRATITDANNNVTYYLSSENSAGLNPAPTPSDPIVFNMNNQNLLSTDVPFTITISVKNSLNLWGEVESPAIYCIHPINYIATSLVASDLNYNVQLNSISTTDNLTYAKNTAAAYTINYIADVFHCDASGDIIGAAVASATQANDMNFNFTGLTTGSLYKLVLNVNYVYTFVDNTTATINELVADTCYYYFIPHDVSNQLSLQANPMDLSVSVSWSAITVQELNGFNLDHYEVSTDGNSWDSNGTGLNKVFTGLTNGTSYTFYVRAVSVSGSSLYMSGVMVNGQSVDITSVPFGNPVAPIFVSQMPGDTKCTIVWELDGSPYNGGLFDKFQAQINSSFYSEISPSFANGQYTYEFGNLINLNTSSIRIRLVTHNQPNTNNLDTTHNSTPFTISTIPFALPTTPTGLIVSPHTNSVTLNWNAVLPSTIINNNVEYEIYYKLHTDSSFTVISNITTNTRTITGLTSNLEYDFKIRSTILNSEVSDTFYSNFTTVYPGRPFIYSNAPVMNLVAGNNQITVNLSPNTNNFFNNTFKYHATITDINGENARASELTNITDSNVQTITFTTLGDSSILVDLTQYTIVAYYEMLNTDNNQYYSSNTVSNTIAPYDANLPTILSSVSGNQSIALTWDVSAFNGYSITDYQLSFDNTSWAIINANSISQIGLNSFTTSVTLDPNGSILVNGQSYDLYVQVLYTVNGENYTSVSSNMVTNIPYTFSTVPTNIQTDPSETQVTLSWSAPSNLGGLALDHYEVLQDSGSWIDVGTDLSYTFTELTNGTSYTFYVRAVTLDALEDNQLIYGSSGFSSNVPYKVPSAPTLNNANFYNVETMRYGVGVTINADSNLYNLPLDYYEAAFCNGEWNQVSVNNTNNTVTFDAVSALNFQMTVGTTYSYQFRAASLHPYLDSINGDVYSINVIPYVPPTVAPTIVSNVSSPGQVTINWDAYDPANLGGLVFDHFEVSKNGDSPISVGSDLTYAFTGLTDGTTYTFSIVAVLYHQYDPIDEYIKTPAAQLDQTPYSLPPAITNLRAVPHNGYVKFTWDSSTAIVGGLTFSNFEISPDNINWLTYNYLSDYNAGEADWAGENGTLVTLYVRIKAAHPDYLIGAVYGPSVSASNIPYAPADMVNSATFVTSSTDQQVTFSWDFLPVENLGGLPLHHYEVSKDAGVTWLLVPDGENSYTFYGLTNGDTSLRMIPRSVTLHPDPTIGLVNGLYDPTIYAYDVPYKIAEAPTNIRSTPGDQQIILSWDAIPVENLGGLPLLFYYITMDEEHWYSTNNTTFTFNVSNTGLTLTNGTSYTFIVSAITTHPKLNSILSYYEYVTNVPYKNPDAPLINSNPSDRQINLSWNTPNLGGLPIDHYELSYNNSVWYDLNLNTDANIAYSTNSESSSITFTGLTNGQSYIYYIRAVTLHPYLGLITSSVSQATNIPFIKPGQVSNIVASAINNILSFSFTPPEDVNNNVFTQYYEYSIDNSVTFSPLYQLLTYQASIGDNLFALIIRSYIINPNNNVIHINGDSTSLNNLQNLDIVSPQNLSATGGNGTVTLTWDAIPNTTIEVYYLINGAKTAVDTTTNNYYTFSGLVNGTSYNFNVAIINSVYSSSRRGTPMLPLIAPQNLSPTIGNGTITLSWDVVSNTTYQVYYATDTAATNKLGIYNNAVSPHTFSGLINGTTYYFFVVLSNDTTYFSYKSATPLLPLLAPVINSVTKSGDNLFLDIDFGNSSSVNIDIAALVAQNNTISGTSVSSIVTYTPSINPIRFTGMSNYTYFSITVSNSVGSTTGAYSI